MRLKVTASSWPWQKRSPHSSHGDTALSKWGWKPIPGMGRFGGGWHYTFGVQVGSRTVILNLIFGMVRIEIRRPVKCSK